MDEKELAEWVRTQFQRANKYLAENGILFKSVATTESRYLAPVMAVWKIVSEDNKRYWVISGDLPVDVVGEQAAATAREAIRHFSYQWQIKAENLRNLAGDDKTQLDYAALLQSKGEMLYETAMDEKLWGSV